MGMEGAEGLEVKATWYQKFWVYFLFLSFSYERAIVYLTSMDRINPRLFDVAFFLGVILILPTLPKRKQKLPTFFKIYVALVIYFTLVAFIWALIVPFQYGKYSIFYAYKYWQAVIVGYIFLQIPLTRKEKRGILYVILIGGVFVSLYCLREYFHPGPRIVFFAPGKFIVVPARYLLGPFGPTYHQLALYSSYLFIISFVFTVFTRSLFQKIVFFALIFITGWPAVFSGSRTGLVFLAGGILISLLFMPGRIKFYTIFYLLILAAVIFQFRDVIFDPQKNYSFYRLIRAEKTSQEQQFFTEEEKYRKTNSILSRLSLPLYFSLENYKAGYLTLLIGAGFYIAPVKSPFTGEYVYRIAYGVHHGYLFPLEQGGIVAFVLFLMMLVFLGRELLKSYRESENLEDKLWAIIGISVFFTFLVIELFAAFIWQGTTNFHSFIMLVYYLATKKSADSYTDSPTA